MKDEVEDCDLKIRVHPVHQWFSLSCRSFMPRKNSLTLGATPVRLQAHFMSARNYGRGDLQYDVYFKVQ